MSLWLIIALLMRLREDNGRKLGSQFSVVYTTKLACLKATCLSRKDDFAKIITENV